MSELELWGGHECTVNRLGETYYDQTRRSGHHERIGDLDLFAGLGLEALRYPVLWERVAPRRGRFDWAWSDERLARIKALNLRPIVGLVHHGGGPAYTSLLDEGFATGLADYARAVAERYPWVRDWTPVNEPLTTARFACLYGHWHPHRQDEQAFWTALVNQVDGVRLAMREIRAVNPEARLIQTEDLGRTYSTRPVADQAQFDNTRRWMTWDLLCGMVTSEHPLWRRLCGFGLQARLEAIAEAPCPPDVIGINHYLTSDRFLDHRCEDYPPDRCGGNGRMRYADVEAVRVALPAPGGLEGALEEAWARYGRTLAVTEAHNGCTREEQVRWLADAWDTALRLRNRGAPIEAVTAWALLGSYDWNSLLTRRIGHYEPGVFELRGGEPRATAAAAFLRSLTTPGVERPAVADGPGWWRRDIRLSFRPVFRTLETPEPRREWRPPPAGRRPLLITGATGTLGKAIARACEWRGIDYVLTSRAQLDLSREEAIATAMTTYQPWAVINAAGWVRVDEAETECDGCMEANTAGALRLAWACEAEGVPFVGFSSDLVFDGRIGRPYLESDAPSPLNVYGRSKAEAESAILADCGRALMIRTAAFFSPYDPHNFAAHLLRTLRRGETFTAADDLVVSPTHVPDLVETTLDLAIDGAVGLWHLANEGAVSWAEFGQLIAATLDLDVGLVRGAPSAEFGWAAPRPPAVALGTERGQLMPSLENAIGRYAAIVSSPEFAGEAEAWVDRTVPPHTEVGRLQAQRGQRLARRG
ncbi:MAG: family 1 glycosylhydrolase [Phenylobacterium sp.]|jgi:dTDP-4-dehydrorhamnose reductase|uniref:family 1 glycosylhydrolase n=1 Tax=Phenylobacterium sp. TaxID=1871053 RepID=UPI002A368EEC|nr:family 1 glycosylhydrolase [Phenylobacterium sp.]MDX9999078.1 family 1 glycosylhydrolase [Phenylobacterium sp.]